MNLGILFSHSYCLVDEALCNVFTVVFKTIFASSICSLCTKLLLGVTLENCCLLFQNKKSKD